MSGQPTFCHCAAHCVWWPFALNCCSAAFSSKCLCSTCWTLIYRGFSVTCDSCIGSCLFLWIIRWCWINFAVFKLHTNNLVQNLAMNLVRNITIKFWQILFFFCFFNLKKSLVVECFGAADTKGPKWTTKNDTNSDDILKTQHFLLHTLSWSKKVFSERAKAATKTKQQIFINQQKVTEVLNSGCFRKVC